MWLECFQKHRQVTAPKCDVNLRLCCRARKLRIYVLKAPMATLSGERRQGKWNLHNQVPIT